jgi:hypothetical protein
MTTSRETVLLEPLNSVEDLFAYACEVRRVARKGGRHEKKDVRAQVDRRLQQGRKLAEALKEHIRFWEDIQPPLACFLDYMIETGADDELAREWQSSRLASKHTIPNGDTAFFRRFLDPDLQAAKTAGAAALETDEGKRRRERLRFYERCLLLGFQGMYDVRNERDEEVARTNAAKLDDYRTQLDERLRQDDAGEAVRPVTPEAGESVCGLKLDLDQAPAFWGMAAIMALFFALFLVLSGWMYSEASSRLANAVDRLEAAHPPGPQLGGPRE